MGFVSLKYKIIKPLLQLFIAILFVSVAIYLFIVSKQAEGIAEKTTGAILENLTVYTESIASFRALQSSAEIKRMVEQLSADPDIREITIMSSNPLQIVISSDKRLLERDISELPETKAVVYRDAYKQGAFKYFDLMNLTYYYANSVLLSDHNNASGLNKSVIFLAYDVSYILKAFFVDLLLSILLMIILMGLFIWLNWQLLSRHLFSKLSVIQNTVEKEGFHKIALPPITQKDEIYILTEKLNEAWHNIEEQTKKLKKSREEANEANLAKSEFLANMSHEIRTPLNGVIGMTQVMLLHPLSDEQKERAETILLSAEQLLSLLNSILDLSKIEAGEITLETHKVGYHAFVEKIRGMWEPQALEKGIDFRVVQYGHPPTDFYTDSYKIMQVLNNLLSNAVKFTSRGSVTLQISTDPINDKEQLLCFDIKDTGIGISVTDQMKLFDKFTQADSSTTRKYGGSGLGLAISREIIQLLGGEIGLVSTEGEGSTFSIALRVGLTEDFDPNKSKF